MSSTTIIEYRFGPVRSEHHAGQSFPYRFDCQTNTLFKDNEPVKAQPKAALKVLRLLLEKNGEDITRKELKKAGWPKIHVSESSLTQAIKALRDIFGDDDSKPQYIQTVEGIGYCFIGKIQDSMATTMALTYVPDKTEADLVRTSRIGSKIRDRINLLTTNKPIFGVMVKLLLVLLLVIAAFIAGWLLLGYNRDPIQWENKNSEQKVVELPSVEDVRQRDLGQAKKLYDQGWNLYEQADQLKKKRQDQLAQDKFAEAEAAFREAIRFGPDLAEYHSALGWALLDQNKGIAATQSFKEALRLKPRKADLAAVHYGLGLSLETLNEFEEAEYELEEAIRSAPSQEKRKEYKTEMKRIRNRE